MPNNSNRAAVYGLISTIYIHTSGVRANNGSLLYQLASVYTHSKNSGDVRKDRFHALGIDIFYPPIFCQLSGRFKTAPSKRAL